jgi:hypothetical protein
LTLAGHIHTLISRKGAEKQRAGGFQSLQKSHKAKRDSSSYKVQYTLEGLHQIVRIKCKKCKLPESEVDDTAPMWDVVTQKYIARYKTVCPTKGHCNEYTYQPKGKRAGKVRARKGEQQFVPVDQSVAWIHIRDVRHRK